MQLQAHRGVCTEYPENTMSAFWGAIYQDYKIIELDPNVTADGKFVILHDNTINRTARRQDGSMVEENRKVTEMTYDEVAQYDYGAWFSPKFKGEKIPLLEEVLEIARENEVLLKIDNKIWDFPQECMDSFWKLLRDSKTEVGITCQSLETVQIAVKELPSAEIHYDGEVTEEILKEIRRLSNRITVWLPFRSKEISWVQVPFASEELCRLVKQYARLGIWIVSRYEDFDEVMSQFNPDIVETPGQIKPVKNQGRLVDMHTHSEHSHDSVCHICDMAAAQQERGMYGFAVTDHCDIFSCERKDVTRNICESVLEVEKLREEQVSDNIYILSGLEMGEGIWYPRVMEDVLKVRDYDVVISSVHIITYKQYTSSYPGMDYTKLSLEELYEYMNHYLDDVLRAIHMVPCDIMAHLLLPLRYINGKYDRGIDYRVFENKVRTILEAIIQKGIALEVNTSCMDEAGQDWFGQDWLLGIYKEMGGLLVTLGSDAHRVEDAAWEFGPAVALLQKHGFRNCFYYEKRRSIQCTIEYRKNIGICTKSYAAEDERKSNMKSKRKKIVLFTVLSIVLAGLTAGLLLYRSEKIQTLFRKDGEILYTPVVFAVEDDYQIIFASNEAGMAWVEIGEEIFYDRKGGLVRSDSAFHKIILPQRVLNEAKAYKVCFEIMYDREEPEKGDVVEQEYAFRPVDLSDGLQIYTLTDTHGDVVRSSDIAGYWGEQLDLLVHAGDAISSFSSLAGDGRTVHTFLEILSAASKGNVPVAYARGNHEARGRFSDQYTDFMPTVGDNTYYTFRLGEIWGIVLDSGEDHPDSYEEFAGTVCFDTMLSEETDFMRQVIENKEEEYGAEGIKYRICVCHIPFGSSPSKWQLIYWPNLLAEMDLDIMLSGHLHTIKIDKPTKMYPYYRVIAGVTKYDDAISVGTAAEIKDGKLSVTFTTQEKRVLKEWIFEE